MDGTARSSEDFLTDRFTVVMAEGQTIATLPISLIDDQSPELDESFSVRLLPTDLTGGATLGFLRECHVNILANDFLNGLFGKSNKNTSYTV